MPLIENFTIRKGSQQKATIQGIEAKGFIHNGVLYLYLKPFFKESFEYSKKVATVLKAFPEHTCIHAGKLHYWDAEILPKLCVTFMDHCVLKTQIYAHLEPFFNLGGVYVLLIWKYLFFFDLIQIFFFFFSCNFF